MLRKSANITKEVINNKTIIDKDTKINGNIKAKDIDILGLIDGNVESEGKITVLGFVKGNLKGHGMVINGQVEGKVESSGLVYINKDAIINGDIEFGSILVEEGAVLKGTFKVNEHNHSDISNTGGIKIKWGREPYSSKDIKLIMKKLIGK